MTVQEEPLCICFMDTTVHETELWTFSTIQTFESGRLSFLRIMHEFRHSSFTQQPILVSNQLHTEIYITRKPSYLVCIFLSWCVFIRKQSAAWLRLKATLQCTRHDAAHFGRWSWKLRYLWIMSDIVYSWITEQPILVRGFLYTETVLFTMFFTFVLYGHKAEECDVTCPIAHEANRCTFWASCSGVSWKLCCP